MNVLITHPDFEASGGVSKYHRELHGKFHVPVQHLTVGRRATEENSLRQISRLLVDYWKFVRCLKRTDVDLVHINHSLDPRFFVRDGTLTLLARLHRKKVVVFSMVGKMRLQRVSNVGISRCSDGCSAKVMPLLCRANTSEKRWCGGE